MDLNQLLSAVTIADTGGVTAAAEQLRVAQPAVTRHIKHLEQELGVTLFRRTLHGTEPTEAGEILLTHARAALDELEQARRKLVQRRADVSGVVTLAVLESVMDLLVPALVEAARLAYPGIDLRIRRATSATIAQWSDADEADMAVLYAPTGAATASVDIRPLVQDEIWLVAPAAASLSETRPVTWASAFARPLVLPTAGHGLRTLIDEAAATLGAPADVPLETNAMSVQKQMARDGRAWTVLPATGVLADVRAGILSGAPLIEPTILRRLVVSKPRRARGLAPIDAVAEVLVKTTAALVDEGAWPGDIL
jgi:LysR family transcriptional regulator, nitrogen assimilation regulatory protein